MKCYTSTYITFIGSIGISELTSEDKQRAQQILKFLAISPEELVEQDLAWTLKEFLNYTRNIEEDLPLLRYELEKVL